MHLFYFVVLAILAHSAYALECQVTDLATLKSGHVKESRQDCTEHIKKLLVAHGLSGQSTDQINMSCYKLEATGASKTVVVKGCIPESGCGFMKRIMKTSLGFVEGVTCEECTHSNCNQNL